MHGTFKRLDRCLETFPNRVTDLHAAYAQINIGFYGHALKAAFNGPERSLLALLTDVKCMGAALFYAVFGAIIAFMKVRKRTKLLSD